MCWMALPSKCHLNSLWSLCHEYVRKSVNFEYHAVHVQCIWLTLFFIPSLHCIWSNLIVTLHCVVSADKQVFHVSKRILWGENSRTPLPSPIGKVHEGVDVNVKITAYLVFFQQTTTASSCNFDWQWQFPSLYVDWQFPCNCQTLWQFSCQSPPLSGP